MLKEVTRVKSKQIRETRWGSGKRRRKGESEWRIGPEGIRWRWERTVFASCWTKWWSWEVRLLMDSLVIWLKSSRNTHNSFLPRRIRLGLFNSNSFRQFHIQNIIIKMQCILFAFIEIVINKRSRMHDVTAKWKEFSFQIILKWV